LSERGATRSVGPARDRRVPRDLTQFFFDRDIDPVTSIAPGESVVVETADSLCGIVKRETDVIGHIDEVFDRLGGACPVTGPIWVEGASAGDCLAVKIQRVVPAPRTGRGWTALIPGLGALVHDQGYTLQPSLDPRSTICDVTRDEIVMPIDERKVTIPAHPFVGTVGVAPLRERRITFSQSPEYLGDVDIPQLTAGATLVLPCHVDGGLLSLGDAHAAQGDAEITGAAIEVEADVTVTVDVLDREEAEYGRLPIVETAEWIGCVAAFGGITLADCIRACFVDLVRRLMRWRGFTEAAAYQLLGQVGRVQVGNMIDPFYSALAFVERRFIE
jgi:amidase